MSTRTGAVSPIPSPCRRGAASPAGRAQHAALAGGRSATPRLERWHLIGLFAWLASPIDLLPEFLPGIGPLDNIVVAALVLRRKSRRLGRDYLRAHWPSTTDPTMLDRYFMPIGSPIPTRVAPRWG